MNAPSRPLLRWHGGKWKLAPWIISHFGGHSSYVEPFGGAWSVGIRKPRAKTEVWNDLDAVLVQLFRVLRDPDQAVQLVRLLDLTPFARDEFRAAYEPSDDPVENARRTIVRSFMGFGSDSTAGHYRTGFRCISSKSGTTPACDWAGYPAALQILIERLRGVTVESRPAAEILSYFDGERTLFYVDPPYLPETRGQGNRRRVGPGSAPWQVYKHELTGGGHAELLTQLRALAGMVVLSGYPSELYDRELDGWRRVERAAHADGARPRREVLWLNPAAAAACPQGALL